MCLHNVCVCVVDRQMHSIIPASFREQCWVSVLAFHFFFCLYQPKPGYTPLSALNITIGVLISVVRYHAWLLMNYGDLDSDPHLYVVNDLRTDLYASVLKCFPYFFL